MASGLMSGRHMGRVHSCFQNGLNLQFGERLFYLDYGFHGLCCFGLVVKESEFRKVLACAHPQDVVTCREGKIRIYGTGGTVILDLNGFRIMDLSVPFYPLSKGKELPETPLYRLLKEQEDELAPGLLKNADFLRNAAILSENRPEAIHYFLGRGQGLTPAGDDLLIGYGVALQVFGQADEFITALLAEPSQTTDISKAYLQAMAEGYANEIFVQLLKQMFSENIEALQGLLEQIKQIGHTSGRDTLYGLYLGFTNIKY